MLRKITKQEYLFFYKKKQSKSDLDLSDYIDILKYSDSYYALNNNAFVGVEYLKNGVVRINGLFSLEPSRGRDLLNTMIENLESLGKTAIVLDCTKELKDKYYTKHWGFYNAWYLSSINYYELVLFL